ncbi:hypothetical protein J3Q64DRAFT_1693817 [Phycomyces blakesleeanus]|uniref:Uncharacterized protein n=1 Tax=Phycomyces blakesleeanus TaxID=4837 RepID=A0ABR3BFS9_PHYBL
MRASIAIIGFFCLISVNSAPLSEPQVNNDILPESVPVLHAPIQLNNNEAHPSTNSYTLSPHIDLIGPAKAIEASESIARFLSSDGTTKSTLSKSAIFSTAFAAIAVACMIAL